MNSVTRQAAETVHRDPGPAARRSAARGLRGIGGRPVAGGRGGARGSAAVPVRAGV